MKFLEPPELDADMRSVIDAARGGHEPNEMARARVRKGVELKMAAGIALAVGPASSAFAGAAVKVTAAVVAVGSVVGAGVYVVPKYVAKPVPVHAPAPRVTAPAAPVIAAPEPVEQVEQVGQVAMVRQPVHRAVIKRRVAPAAAAAVVESASSLKEETALLGGANAALARGDVARAQTILREYDRRPGAGSGGSGGLLAQERMVTGILASCAAGQIDAARAEARQFHARWPRSPLASRVDGSCAGKADPARSVP
jgi:hypothetical protein